ncbi:Putative uncharacterized protein [Lacticaseibacillus paracasei]|nr:Putative uncharacterized protein [Lacticaseibacillus paracasei]
MNQTNEIKRWQLLPI